MEEKIMSKKIVLTILMIIFLAASTPLMAQEDNYIDLNNYDLDLTIEQKNILQEELSTIVDISGEIDLGMIKIILGELEEDEDFEEDYDQDKDYDQNNDRANFGRGLARRIKEYKANNEDWTGQGLSNIIHNYMENNHPGKGKAKGTGNNNGKGNGPGNSNNNPGKGN
jgi:hypothetical protein